MLSADVQAFNKTDWSAVKEYKSVQVYRHKQKPARILTLLQTKTPEVRPLLSQSDLQSEVAKIEDQRSWTNKILGQQNWKISKAELIPVSPGQAIYLSGSYVLDNIRHSFFELHVFQNNHYKEFQIIDPQAARQLSDEEAKSILMKVFNPQ